MNHYVHYMINSRQSSSLYFSCPLYHAAVMLEPRLVIPDGPVIINAGQNQIAFVMHQPVRVFLPVDLCHGRVRVYFVLQFNQLS